MTLTEWTEANLKTINLFSDETVDVSTGAVCKKSPKIRELAISVITSNTAREFYDAARQLCPVGTILEEFDETWWTSIWTDKTIICRMLLTKAMIDERFRRSAEMLMKILEKRTEHFADKSKQKTVEVKNADSSLNIVFTTV